MFCSITEAPRHVAGRVALSRCSRRCANLLATRPGHHHGLLVPGVKPSEPLCPTEHVLDAHHWDLNNSVAFYLESGGVGHGLGPGAAGQEQQLGAAGWPEAEPAPAIVEEVEDEPPPARATLAAAAARPSSHPIEVG